MEEVTFKPKINKNTRRLCKNNKLAKASFMERLEICKEKKEANLSFLKE